MIIPASVVNSSVTNFNARYAFAYANINSITFGSNTVPIDSLFHGYSMTSGRTVFANVTLGVNVYVYMTTTPSASHTMESGFNDWR